MWEVIMHNLFLELESVLDLVTPISLPRTKYLTWTLSVAILKSMLPSLVAR